MGAALTASLLTLGGIALAFRTRANELDAMLDLLFQDVMRRVSAQLAEGVAPYSRFVNSEGEWLSELQTKKTEGGIASAKVLRDQINKACS
jgi:hypothetical protein